MEKIPAAMTEVYPMPPLTSKENLLEVREVLRQTPDEEGLFDIPEHPNVRCHSGLAPKGGTPTLPSNIDIKMDYEHIFAEPISYKTKGLGRHIHPGMTKVFGGAFNYVQSTVYYVLVMITGLFLATFYGIFFGLCIYMVNWFVHPFYKLTYITLRLLYAIYRPLSRITLDPFFQSVGQCFSSIRVAAGVHLKGVSVSMEQTRFTSVAKLREV